MNQSDKKILLCNMSADEVEIIRNLFVVFLGLSNEQYKAVNLDYSDIIKENSFFETTTKLDMVFVLPKGIFNGTIGLADYLDS